ncbi:MAG: TIGR02300 family protein [Alphaproteobacteria bacterium]|nr:TIGR02300 family protein [Alphaproteobacteria bacterium]
MAKPEWGEKRICQPCKAMFYDMKRSPIVCPKCSAEFNPEAGKKPRRSKGTKAKEAPKIQAPEIIPENLEDAELLNVEGLEEIEEITLEDDGFIEDTVELEDDSDEVDGIIALPKRLSDS